MKTVWKFGLSAGLNIVHLPMSARILTVAAQHGNAVLYALLDPKETRYPRKVMVVSTGAAFDASGATYIGLIDLLDGHLMFHAFSYVD